MRYTPRHRAFYAPGPSKSFADLAGKTLGITTDLAQRIAKHLTGPWTVKRRGTPDGEELPKHAEIVRDADGATITVHVGGFRLEGRVTFGTG